MTIAAVTRVTVTSLPFPLRARSPPQVTVTSWWLLRCAALPLGCGRVARCRPHRRGDGRLCRAATAGRSPPQVTVTSWWLLRCAALPFGCGRVARCRPHRRGDGHLLLVAAGHCFSPRCGRVARCRPHRRGDGHLLLVAAAVRCPSPRLRARRALPPTPAR